MGNVWMLFRARIVEDCRRWTVFCLPSRFPAAFPGNVGTAVEAADSAMRARITAHLHQNDVIFVY
jgi:hypothetical protein